MQHHIFQRERDKFFDKYEAFIRGSNKIVQDKKTNIKTSDAQS